MKVRYGIIPTGLALFLVATVAAVAADLPYKKGDRVASPTGSGKYFESVIIDVNPKSDAPYRVHPLGYLNTMDEWDRAQVLRPMGSVKTEPLGHIADDPYLLAAQGKKAFKPTQLFAANYQCWTLSGGTHMVAAIGLTFSILDASRYRDGKGTTGSYRFDPNTSRVVFIGGAFNGRQGKYEQASNPPTREQPPTVVLDGSGDDCQPDS